MKSNWKVTANDVGGKMHYAAVRIRDVDRTDHSGNREYHGDWFTDRNDAEKLVEELNRKEEVKEKHLHMGGNP